MRVVKVGQFDHSWPSRDCYVCGEFADAGIIGDYRGAFWLCHQHQAEYLRRDTDWWELIRLMREAKDERFLALERSKSWASAYNLPAIWK